MGWGPLDCTNDANFLDIQADSYVTPFYNESNGIALRNDPDPKQPYEIPHTNNKFFVMPAVADLKQVHDYLENDPRGQSLLKQKPALATFLDGMENQTFNVLSVYGYKVQEGEIHEADCFPSNILQIITAARYAQLNASFQKRALIIPVFYDYQKESDLLMNTIIPGDNWGKYEKPGVENAREVLRKLGLRSPQVFSIANISDPSTIQRIQKLQPGQILLLSLGSLPKVVFDGLYTHTGINIWPQIREGAGSFNSLVLTGRPHVRCGNSWDIGYDQMKDSVLKKQFENFYEMSCKGPKAWQDRSSIYKELGQFFIDANDPNSSLSNYFKFLKEEALQLQNDRVYLAVDDIMKRIN